MIFILSMHRSGSSLLAGLLQENGFNLGADEQLIAGNKDNPKGFKELRDVVDLNESMLEYGAYTHMLPNIENVYNPNYASSQIESLANKIKEQGVQVLKDPRLCLTLWEWLPHFENPKIIFLTRNPIDVANSLLRRQSYPLHAGLALWEFYNYKALQNSQGLDVCHVDFDKLSANPAEQVAKVVAWLNSRKGKADRLIRDGVSTNFYDEKLFTSKEDKLEEILSSDQAALYKYLKTPKEEYSGPFTSRSMQRSMDIIKHLVEMGYVPGAGRMLDQKYAVKMENLKGNLKQSRAETKEAKKIINDFRKTLEALLLYKKQKELGPAGLAVLLLLRKGRRQSLARLQKMLNEVRGSKG